MKFLLSFIIKLLISSVPSADVKSSINDEPSIELSLVVPAYNEELRLGAMLDPTLTFLQSWCGQQKISFEVALLYYDTQVLVFIITLLVY